jgi:flagellar basal body-associated protein FliL
MVGFGKKKKKDKGESKASKTGSPKTDDIEEDEPKQKAVKKKKPIKKIIFVVLLVLIAIGASSYVVYTMYFNPSDPGAEKPVYRKIQSAHINLPEEMLRFSFDHFPNLYFAMITFNAEMDLIDKETARIDAIAQEYPDQKQIADKEKKTWTKAQAALQKTFLKIEKPVKETYVLFQVNKEMGQAKIEEKNTALVELAQTALTTVQELTQTIKSQGQVPQGLIKGSIYKLKKNFL